MTDFARSTAYPLIEDRLDAVGQKYRVQMMIRGGMLWVAGAIVSSLAAGLVAHFVGAGTWASVILAAWIAWLLGSAGVWGLRPMLMRPKPVEVARLVESRVPELHNGLTNSVLLSTASDLHTNPWLPTIFDEILAAMRKKSIDEAVKLSDLKPLGIRLGIVVAPLLLALMIFPRPFVHGWQQMLAPTTFVPVKGSMEIVDVMPKDATLVSGQPLEIVITAKGPEMPDAKLIFDNKKYELASLVPSQMPDKLLRYTYRLDHVEEATKFRVEVGATQSPWYSVNVVRQVKLEEIQLRMTPPSYTKQQASSLTLKPGDVEKTRVEVPQGSRIELSMLVDVAVDGAMLQVAENAPAEMEKSQQGRLFTGLIVAMEDSSASVLLTQGSGQIIARLPEPSLTIFVTKDAPPSLEMKWPTQDMNVPVDAELKIAAAFKDDYGVATSRVLMGVGEEPLVAVSETNHNGEASVELAHLLDVKSDLRKHGSAIRVQVEVIDNRDLLASGTGFQPVQATSEHQSTQHGLKTRATSSELGGQTTQSPIFEIKFREAEKIAAEQKEQSDELRARLLELLKMQQDLHSQAVAFKSAKDLPSMEQINKGQSELRMLMQNTVDTFKFDEETQIIQKTLLVLVYNPAKEAIELSSAVIDEPVEKEQKKLNRQLQARQRQIITALESLLAALKQNAAATTQPAQKEGADLPNQKEELKKLQEALKEFIKEEQRILDQTSSLAKKPVDNFTDADKKLLEDLLMAQEKMEAFMQQKISDFSKMAEQDMANASLLKELLEVYSEVTMAKDALKKKATEIAVAAEDMGLELAKEIESNLEKWLMNEPDRVKWLQEDPIAKNDTPMAELPKELEDMIGELMEEQEDLFEEMEDQNANWTDSMDKGAGWDAADGPIANMSAKGVTGNQQPNNNEMAGRAGEGRQGKSQGEFVEDTATGKGGRNTPTRLDPTPFQQGQVKDESKEPTGGASGGGKISGQGGQGLEGPVPPALKQEMDRLADKQAQIRNTAERLNLQNALGRYDNFKMLESIALMRRVESDLKANRYQNALRRKDVMLDAMATSHLMTSGRIHVQQDTSPTMSDRMEDEINDAMKGTLPAAWSEALKEYYKKLATE